MLTLEALISQASEDVALEGAEGNLNTLYYTLG